MFKVLSRALWVTLFGAILALPAAAQVPMSTGSTAAPEEIQINPEEMTPEAIDAMVARMSDDQVRALLLDRLDAVAEAAQQEVDTTPLSERLAVVWTGFISRPLDAIQKLPNLLASQAVAVQVFADTYGGATGVLRLFGLIAFVLVVGYIAERAVGMILARRRTLEVDQDQDSLYGAINFLFRRFLREIFGLIVFFFVIRVLGRILLSPEELAFAGPFVNYLIWMPRMAAAASRFLLAPSREDLRLVSADNHTASYLHRNLIGLVLLGGFTLFAISFNVRAGISMEETRLAFWLDSAVYVYIAIMAWTVRDGLRAIMLGSDPDVTGFDKSVSWNYPYFAMFVAAGTWVLVGVLSAVDMVAPLGHGAHYYTMFVLLAVPVIDTAIRGIVRHVVPPMIGEGAVAEDAYRATKRSYVRIGRVIALGIVMMLIARAWDASLSSLLRESAGIADNLFSFGMTCVVGYVAYEAVSLWINRRLAAEHTAMGMSQDDADAGEIGGAGASRLSTVLPLALVSARSTIIVIFGLLAVGNLGVDITPLLAGAGIAGLAIGFGAQKLVSDVVSGVFFLIDDAFRVGEYVEIAGTMGAVEKISIRSMQLRHHRGAVHTIPYGEIPQLTNYSRDWVIMKLKFTVPFDTNPNQIKKIFKKIGQEMLEDELFKDDFLQPFKSQGVFDIDDVGMVIRGKFMAKPGKQFMIRKEIFNKIKAAFAEAGIDFARREVRVAIPGMEHQEDMTEEQQAQVAAAGAAAAAAQPPGQAPGGGGSKPGD
ncbi:mechanosensitive ion channel family protein [uncultured Shimia sp.]|uniref:mechanosensitive ion channel family protein n=1 Tax=uncultured Shimia sp. TaxID=573152 RepID=UPI002625E66F|nr:mechanosensitive ion channel family protein [uncultured Shimia sp.]